MSDVPSKAEKSYGWLREKIRTREYEPGHRLVLSQIAEELDVSVVPVREAIRQLEAEGLVTFERNIGAKVTTHNRDAYFEAMETVALLEGQATALSAPILSVEDLHTAQDINQQMKQLIQDFDPVAFTELNKEFHTALFYKCPNKRLKDLLLTEWEQLEYHRVSTFRYVPERAQQSIAEHEQLVNLISASADQDYIEKMARRHRLATSASYRNQLELQHQGETNEQR